MISRAVAPHAVSPLIAHRHCRRLCRAHSSQAVHQLLDDTAWLLPSPAVEVGRAGAGTRQHRAASACRFAVLAN